MFEDNEILNYDMIAKRYGMTKETFLLLPSCYRQEIIKRYLKMMIKEKNNIEEKGKNIIKKRNIFERKKR